jgi:hypothetical protein
LKDRVPDKNDGLAWRWSRGPAVLKAEYGDPLATTGYAICVYDAGGGLVVDAAAPAGGICHARTKRPCWKSNRRGFAYRNPDREAAPIQAIDLREGASEGKARIAVRARGPLLGLPNLQTLALPLQVQLQASSGLCFEASYSPPARRQSAKSFVARAD